MSKKYVSWRRVSTKKQGQSQLGLEAQTDIIKSFAKDNEIIADFHETYTGTDLFGCIELQKAIKMCKETGAVLIIAKTNRFRNVIQALQIVKQLPNQIEFCNVGIVDEFLLTFYFSLAQRDAKILSIQTKAALQAKKKREGSWINEYGKNTGAKLSDTIKIAQAESSKARRMNAKNNPNNKRFFEYVKQFKETNLLNNREDFQRLAIFLNKIGLKTAKGYEFNINRTRAMLNKCEQLYSA